MALSILSGILGSLLGIEMCRRYAWSLPRLWSLAGVPASIVVGRATDFDRLIGITLPQPLLVGSIILAVVLILGGLLGFAFKPDGEVPAIQPAKQLGARPALELRYAVVRDKAAWNEVYGRVWLWLVDEGAPPAPRDPLSLFASLEEVPPPQGRRIWAAYSYDIIFENAGTDELRGLQLTMEFEQPYNKSEHEQIIEVGKSTAPTGVRLDLARVEHGLQGTCDLLNPNEQLGVRFYTWGPMGLPLRGAKLRLAARYPKLPPLVECPWPERGGHLAPQQPAPAEVVWISRTWVLLFIGKGVDRIGVGLGDLSVRVRLLARWIGLRRSGPP